MRDRFSNLAAVCCEETIAKSRNFVCLCLVLECFGKKPQIYFRPGRQRDGRLGISRKMEKRFGGADWIERRWHAVCTNDSCMAEEVEPYVSFFIASRLEAPSPWQLPCTDLGSMTKMADR
jgi:hypothetical protein